MYQWGLLIGGGALGLVGVGKIYKTIGLTTKASRFFWGILVNNPGISPGGGGPGHSPISTATPPSLVEQGRAMAEPGKYGRTPSPSVGKESRASRGSPRKRCPPGYRWSRKHRKCMKADRLFPFRPWYSRSKYTNGKSK